MMSTGTASGNLFQCSSASRKFLNGRRISAAAVGAAFQCSSASRKFLNAVRIVAHTGTVSVSVLFSEPKIPQCKSPYEALLPWRRFSALQRAENSSMYTRPDLVLNGEMFQCSSASRKFLNGECLSVLRMRTAVSVLFSEPKIPQSRPSHLRPSIFPTATITLRRS